MATNITSQTGIRGVSRLYDDVELFRGITRLDDGNIAQFDPKITGYATFFWTKMPPFMLLWNKDLTVRFKNYTEKAHTSFDGIPDMTLATEDITGGIAGNSFKVVSNAKDDFDEFTIKVYELQGNPVKEAIEAWATGIRDPKSGYAHYHGVVDIIEGGYCARNHTGEVIYIETDPTGRSKGVEYACQICNVTPTKVPKSHHNYTHGDHSTVQLDLSFSGTKYESKTINLAAVKALDASRKIEHYLEYAPKTPISIL